MNIKKLRSGAFQAVRNCMKINSKDSVIIVTDEKQKKVSRYLLEECLKITSNVQEFILEDFGVRPLKKIPSKIVFAAKNSTAIFYTATSLPGEKAALRLPLISLGTKKGREAHMPDLTLKILEQGLNTDYKLIKKISQKVHRVVSKSRKIRVTTEKGTDFRVEINPKWRWIICDGDILNSPTHWSNLPDGEVFTCPYNLNGLIIADGAIGDYFEEFNPLKEPVIICITDCKVSSISCKNKKLESELKKYIKQDKNASRVGEFSIGTNIGLTKFVGNMLQDEKFPGVHIALGDSYPEETKADFPSKAHCDFVIKKTNIFVDDKLIMKEGKFLI